MDSDFTYSGTSPSRGRSTFGSSLLSPTFKSSTRLQKSPLERIHQKEMSRITELWEDTKEELKRTGEEIKEFEESQKYLFQRKEREYLEEIGRLKTLADQLRERVGLTEQQLSKLRIDKANLEVQLEEKEEKLKKSESLLEVRSSMLRSKQQQIQDLSDQVNDISLEREDALSKSTRDVLSKESQVKNLEIKLSLAESKIKQQEEDIKFLTKLNSKNSSVINQLEEVKEEQQLTFEQMKAELETAKDQIHVLKSRKRYKLDMENRIEQLMADNARLTKLLASTGKFDDFLQYNEDNEGLSFIQMSDEYSGKEKLVHPKGEWKYWVPQEAYDVAKNFQQKYLPNARDDLFAELLVKLNEAWHKREVKKINQLKTKHNEALKDLRRQLQQKLHFEDVIQLDRIDHLKKELKKAQSPVSKKMKEIEGQVFDSTLAAVDSLSKELASLKRENRTLKNNSFNGDTDTPFLEGAAWMGRRVVDLADKMGEKISSLALDFDQKVILESSKSTSTPQQLVKMQGTFFRTLERYILAFREKLRKLFEKVLQAIEDGDDSVTLKLSTLKEDDFIDVN